MNFFKSAVRKVKQATMPAPTTEQIHREVYSAHQLLLNESEFIAAALLDDEGKRESALALFNMGFYNAANIGKPVLALDQRDLILSYQQRYPRYKFITEETVKQICDKYNLYLCGVRDYIDTVPAKNQAEIIAFRVHEKDLNNHYYRISGPYYDEKLMVDSVYREEYKARYAEYKKRLAEMEASEELLPAEELKIVAPESKIDMRNKRKVGHQIVADDPIVLQPVKGGYLIVTAWGEEASDEMVVNEKFN